MMPLETVCWAEPGAWAEVLGKLRSLSLDQIKMPVGFQEPSPLRLQDGVAVIAIDGPISRRGGLMQALFGGASVDALSAALDAAVASPDVRSIVLQVDSPGGTVSGLPELAAKIRAARQVKPVLAQIERLGASAAYFLASQASRVYAEQSALVGSIGTLLVAYDWSQFFAEAGVRPVVMTTGEHKGFGVQGAEITAAQQAEMQRIVDQFQAEFLQAVAAGRDVPLGDARAWADGRVFTGPEAKGLGLVDKVQPLADTLAVARRVRSPLSPRGAVADLDKEVFSMSQESPAAPTTPAPLAASPPTAPAPAAPAAPKPATAAEIKAACPGASAEFVLAQLEAGAPLTAVQSAWAADLAAQNAELKRRLAEAPTAKPPAAPGKFAPVPAGRAPTAPAGDPVQEWKAKFDAKLQAGRSRSQAVSELATAEPELHQAYLAAAKR